MLKQTIDWRERATINAQLLAKRAAIIAFFRPHSACPSRKDDEFATTFAPTVVSGQTTAEDTIRSVVDDLLVGEYNDPVRVIGFYTTERSLRDVSEEVAREIRQLRR